MGASDGRAGGARDASGTSSDESEVSSAGTPPAAGGGRPWRESRRIIWRRRSKYTQMSVTAGAVDLCQQARSG